MSCSGAGAVGMAVAEALACRSAQVRVVNRSGLREPMAGVASVPATSPIRPLPRRRRPALGSSTRRWTRRTTGGRRSSPVCQRRRSPPPSPPVRGWSLMDNVYMYGRATARPFAEARA